MQIDWNKLVKDMSLATLPCTHDRVTSEIEDSTARSGQQHERIVPVRVFTCQNCGLEWCEDYNGED